MGEIFRILSEFYKFPESGFYEALWRGDIWRELAEMMQKYGFSSAAFDELQEQIVFTDYEAMKRAYCLTFISIGREAAVPVESVYKVWTTDQSSGIGFADSKGYLMGDSALHVRYMLERLQIELPDELSRQPDHISVLLELLGYFVDQQAVQETRQFIKDHFDWLADFKAQIQQVRGHNVYLCITQVVIDVVEALQRRMIEEQQGNLC